MVLSLTSSTLTNNTHQRFYTKAELARLINVYNRAVMPIEWLVQYWQRAAKTTLPFLTNRKVAVQQMFDGKILYRRHGGKGLPDRIGWIEINSAADILKWARLHTYSFHPHLNGDRDLWFVMDIDGRIEKAFPLVQIAAYEMSRLLSGKTIKHLVKFSGNRGFHFLWSLGKTAPNWLSLRKRVRSWARELEKVLQAKYKGKFYHLIPKTDPIIVTSSTDKKHKKSILIDEQIIHKNGMIRSPYSIHPKTGLVSAPLRTNEILSFKPEQARPERVRIQKIGLPVNP